MTDRFRASRKAYKKARFKRELQRFFSWCNRQPWWQDELREAARQFRRGRIVSSDKFSCSTGDALAKN